MKTEILSQNEQLASAADIRVEIEASDFAESVTAGESLTINALPVSNGEIVQLVGMYIVKPFASSTDEANNSTLISIGDGVTPARYMAETETNAGGAYVSASAGTGVRFAYQADDTVDVTVKPAAGKALNTIDGGRILLLFKRVLLGDFLG